MMKTQMPELQRTRPVHPAGNRLTIAWLALALVILAVGCIEPNQTTTKAEVIEKKDVTTDVDEAEVAEPDVTGEEIVEEDVVLPPECDGDGDPACNELASDCSAAACVEGRCAAVPLDAFCQVPTTCASETQAYCMSGGCYQPNEGCAGFAVDGCHKATCGESGNCEAAPIGGAPCVIERQTVDGFCDGLYLNPVDVCSNEGVCNVREANTNAVLADTQAITDSNWWIITHRAAESVGKSRAGTFDFARDGTWTVVPHASSDFGAPGQQRRGNWCLDAAGGLALSLGSVVENFPTADAFFLSAIARDSKIIAGAGVTNNDLLIGTRVGGDPADVDGAYSVFMTRKSAGGQTLLYAGSMTFKAGELEDSDRLDGEGTGLLVFAPTLTQFSNKTANGLTQMNLNYEDLAVEDAPKLVTESMVGAIAPDGSSVVLIRGNLEPQQLDYGIMVMTKAASVPATPSPAPAWYSVGLQIAPLGGLSGLGFTALPALMLTRGTSIVGGIFGNEGESWQSTDNAGRVAGGTFLINDAGDLNVELLLAASRQRFGGFMSAARDFGVLFGVPPAEVDDPSSFAYEPKGRNFGFLVKRNESTQTLSAGN